MCFLMGKKTTHKRVCCPPDYQCRPNIYEIPTQAQPATCFHLFVFTKMEAFFRAARFYLCKHTIVLRQSVKG